MRSFLDEWNIWLHVSQKMQQQYVRFFVNFLHATCRYGCVLFGRFGRVGGAVQTTKYANLWDSVTFDSSNGSPQNAIFFSFDSQLQHFEKGSITATKIEKKNSNFMKFFVLWFRIEEKSVFHKFISNCKHSFQSFTQRYTSTRSFRTLYRTTGSNWNGVWITHTREITLSAWSNAMQFNLQFSNSHKRLKVDEFFHYIEHFITSYISCS